MPYLKNWKTTALGLLGALYYAYEAAIQKGCDFADVNCWIMPVVIAGVGFFSRDADKSSEQSK